MAQTSPGAPKRRRWLRRILAVLALLVGLIAAGPQIVAKTPLLATIVQLATASAPAEITIERATLGWSGPLVLNAVHIRTRDADPVGSMARIEVDAGLWRLLTRPNDIGVVRIIRPHLNLKLRSHGSNVEDIWLAMLTEQPSSKSQPLKAHIQITDGTVDLFQADQRTWHFSHVKAQIPVHDLHGVQANLTITGPDGASGNCSLDVTQDETKRVVTHVRLEDVPLEIASIAAARWGLDLAIKGQTSGQVTFSTSPTAPFAKLTSQLGLSHFELSQPNRNRSPLRLPVAKVDIDVEQHDQNWLLNQVTVDAASQLQVSVQGEIPAAVNSLRGPSLLRAIAAHPIRSQGHINLSDFAHLLPTLEGPSDARLQVQQGTIDWKLANSQRAGSSLLEVQLETSDLTGKRDGQIVQLGTPARVDLRLDHHAGGFAIERLQVRSDFLAMDGNGNIHTGEIGWRADIRQLSAQLKQVVPAELRFDQVHGNVEGTFSWQTNAKRWVAETQITGTSIQLDEQVAEPHVRLHARAEGEHDRWHATTIALASLDVTANQDSVRVHLAEPVPGIAVATTWPLHVELRGELSDWQRRLNPFFDLSMVSAAGKVQLDSNVRVSPQQIDVQSLSGATRDLSLQLGQTVIQEPNIAFSAVASYDARAGVFVCRSAKLDSATAKLEASQVTWPTPHTTSVPKSRIQLNASLQRLWRRWQPDADAWPAGMVNFNATLGMTPGHVSFDVDNTIEDFRWVTQPRSRRPTKPNVIWHEPKIRLSAVGDWRPDDGYVQIEQGRLLTGIGSMNLAGQVDDLAGRRNIQLTGSTEVDLTKAATILRPWIGSDVELVGKVAQPFSLRGPLTESTRSSVETQYVSQRRESLTQPAPVPRELEGHFGVGWAHAAAWGIESQRHDVRFDLAQQSLRMAPTEIPLNYGRLRLSPRMQLRPPWAVHLEKGVILEDAQITPELCRRWLKYVAPLLADVTNGQGNFSVRLSRARIPLLNPRRSSIGGSVIIKSGQFGPGPLASRLINLGTQIRAIIKATGGRAGEREVAWMSLPPQTVSFRVEDGVVAHQNLMMNVGGMTIRTRGHVNFDQSMTLTAEVIIPRAWVGHQAWLQGIAGKPLPVKIRGTLQRPEVDRRILKALSQQAARGALEGFLRDL